MSKPKAKRQELIDPTRGPLFTPRFILALLLMVGGIAWIVYYYVVVRVDPTVTPPPEAGKPAFMADLEDWNYLIGFGMLMRRPAGLGPPLDPARPRPRRRRRHARLLPDRSAVDLHVLRDEQQPVVVPVMNDLGQKNLFVGIGFMAVGFTFATRWE